MDILAENLLKKYLLIKLMISIVLRKMKDVSKHPKHGLAVNEVGGITSILIGIRISHEGVRVR